MTKCRDACQGLADSAGKEQRQSRRCTPAKAVFKRSHCSPHNHPNGDDWCAYWQVRPSHLHLTVAFQWFVCFAMIIGLHFNLLYHQRMQCACRKYPRLAQESSRPHGLLYPPVNPFLRESELPRQRSHTVWGRGQSASEGSDGEDS